MTLDQAKRYEHPFIQARRGNWRLYDDFFDKVHQEEDTLCFLVEIDDWLEENCLWIPRIIDKDFERSLLGMVKDFCGLSFDGTWACKTYKDRFTHHWHYGVTPSDALLTAIWHQNPIDE